MSTDVQNYGLRVEQIEALSAIIHEDQIKDRPGGGGRRLKYIKADMAIDTANRIFGYGQWGYKVVSRGHIVADDPKKGKMEMYTADVELWVTGAAFTFPGGGVGIVNDPYTIEMHEKAYKEAETDAMKRALRHYGDQFGLSLYNEDDPIEARDGSIKQVRDAIVQNKKPQPQKRVVDASCAPKQIPAPASPSQQPAAQPTSINKAPSVKALRKKCDELFGPGQWNAVLAILFNAIIPDDNIIPEQASQINSALSSNATEQQIASIRKLCQHLGKDEPEKITELNYIVARRIVKGLTDEYKASHQNQAS